MSNIQTQSAGMSQLQRLQALQESNKKQAKQSNMTAFTDIVGVYLGTEPKEHFPKLLDSEGNKVKDEKGADKRSETADGYTYTFAEFGTCKKIQIVLQNRVKVQLMGAYKLSGHGYDIKSSNMYFIEKDTIIVNY